MRSLSSVDSKELGLAAGLVFARYFLNTDHLHYGYWPDDLPVDIQHLSQAQDLYCDFLLSHIPSGTHTILDVGCGAGIMSKRMLSEGFHVESVSPSLYLSSLAKENLGDKGLIHQSTFEELTLDRKFDLLLFSESFQYIDLARVFAKSRDLLTEKGHLLICDFFRRDDATGESGLGGGHSLKRFYEELETGGFTVEKDLDITANTAPNMDLVGNMMEDLGKPLWDLFLYYIDSNYPRASRFARWRYKKKIQKIERKYFSGRRNARTFAADKSYRLLLLEPQTSSEFGVQGSETKSREK